MISLGLVGKNISQSLSHVTYESILDSKIDYSLFDHQNAEGLKSLDDYFKTVQGLSITSPYKKDMAKQCELIGISHTLKAVNCIRYNGKNYEGCLTDYSAAKRIISKLIFNDVIVLGNGIMAQMMMLICEELGIQTKNLYRANNSISDFNYQTLDKNLIVNCCADEFSFTHSVSESNIFWDFNYNHKEHFEHFNLMGVKYLDGKSLLYEQAKDALSFWKLD